MPTGRTQASRLWISGTRRETPASTQARTLWSPIHRVPGSMRSGRVSQQEKIRAAPTDGRTPERPTSDGDSFSLLPTPTAQRYGSNRGGSAGRVGKERASLDSLARRGLLPTPVASTGTSGSKTRRSGGPTLRTAVGARCPSRSVLPTPTVKGNHNKAGLTARSGDGLATVVGGTLHPRFVEWMMGLPCDWTVPAPMTAEEMAQKRAMLRKKAKPPTRGE